MPRARVGEHADDLHPAVAGDRCETRVRHQSSSSMTVAISSTRTPRTAISGAYTTSSAAQTIVPRASWVMPTMFSRIVLMFSLIRIALALSGAARSEEHTSELQSLAYLVCRLLLEKKKKQKKSYIEHDLTLRLRRIH